MKWIGISLTRNGIEVLQQLKDQMIEEPANSFVAYSLDEYSDNEKGINSMGPSVEEFVSAQFSLVDGLVFVCAISIAVREIAPCLKSKATDPAVIVIDDQSNYVISMLPGHLGGANEWARRLALMLRAEAIITTATEVNDLFTVEDYAKRNNLWISSIKQANAVSARICRGHLVQMKSKWTEEDNLPRGLTLKKQPLVIHVDTKVAEDGLTLIPRTMSLGIGCDKNTSAIKLEAYVREELKLKRIPVEAIVEICSIDGNRNNEAILALSQSLKLPYQTYSKDKLNQIPGVFEESECVRQALGVGNVCERAAVSGARARMKTNECCSCVLHTSVGEGMTMAIAMVVKKLSYK